MVTQIAEIKEQESPTPADIAHVIARAREVFGNDTVALDWLQESHPILGVPIVTIQTRDGLRRVEEMLHRADHGIF